MFYGIFLYVYGIFKWVRFMENEMKNMLTKNNRDLILLGFDKKYRYSVIFRLRKSIPVSCKWIKNSINCLNLNENDGKKKECETCLYRCAQQYWYIGYIKKRFIITDIWNNSYILTFLFLLLREINISRSALNLLIFFLYIVIQIVPAWYEHQSVHIEMVE